MGIFSGGALLRISFKHSLLFKGTFRPRAGPGFPQERYPRHFSAFVTPAHLCISEDERAAHRALSLALREETGSV